MIVLGEGDLVTAMRLMGVSQAHEVYSREDIEHLKDEIKENDIRIISSRVAELMPELAGDPYTVVIPEPGKEMSSLNDLKKMMVDSLGITLPEQPI